MPAVAYDHGDRIVMSLVCILREGDARCLETANILLRMISGRTAFELHALPAPVYYPVDGADEPMRLASEEGELPPEWHRQDEDVTQRSIRLARIFKARRERRTRAH